jgi:hypothetical protein
MRAHGEEAHGQAAPDPWPESLSIRQLADYLEIPLPSVYRVLQDCIRKGIMAPISMPS